MHAVILSGGVGSRLWPVSRDLYPKPFIRTADGYSLLQKVFLRCASINSIKSITSVTNREFVFKIKDEYAEITKSDSKSIPQVSQHYILEPFGKNTAAAIATSALYLQNLYGKDAVMLVVPSDHIITNQQTFHEAVIQASALAGQGKIVTFGINPTSPETGYGYIEVSDIEVKGFFEKPSLEKAQMYLESGNFLWNSGIFCFTAGAILAEFKLYCPDILSSVKDCIEYSHNLYEGQTNQSGQISQMELNPEYFARVREESIDYAIMENSQKVAVVACDIGWSDVGNWVSMSNLLDKDKAGNNINGQAILHNVSNCYIESSERIVGAVGINNLVVIDTADALLVANKDNVQEVKNIYKELKKQNHITHKLHKTVHRPWGSYTVLEEGSGFKIKRIVVNPKASLSLQSHNHRAEHWVVVEGEAIVVNNDNILTLQVGESTYIPTKTKHRLSNKSQESKLIIIEVQTGNYLGEDDIIRFEDVYGRVSNI